MRTLFALLIVAALLAGCTKNEQPVEDYLMEDPLIKEIDKPLLKGGDMGTNNSISRCN
jgi:ABC-type uncharacterized transport system auxiliary subunit